MGLVTDNARCMVAAKNIIFDTRNSVFPLRCATHIMNLIVQQAFKEVNFLVSAHNILTKYITSGVIKRYCVTRFLGIYIRLIELKKYFESRENLQPLQVRESEKIVQAERAIKPFVDVLNLSHSDGVSWPNVYSAFINSIQITEESGFENLAGIAKQRIPMMLNEIVALDLFIKGERPLEPAEERKINTWLLAINVTDFMEYVANREFHGPEVPLPRLLGLFYKEKLKRIAVSEAAVERCFYKHKLIHCPMKAAMKDDIVEDCLFIRYNYSLHFGEIFEDSKIEDNEEDEEQLNALEPIDDMDD